MQWSTKKKVNLYIKNICFSVLFFAIHYLYILMIHLEGLRIVGMPRLIVVINARQAELGLTNRELAEAVGYSNFNVISMIKNGKTKLPTNKVGEFAKALKLDPIWLYRLAMSEYMPGALASIEECFGPLITSNEQCLVSSWRAATGGCDPEIDRELGRGLSMLIAASRQS